MSWKHINEQRNSEKMEIEAFDNTAREIVLLSDHGNRLAAWEKFGQYVLDFPEHSEDETACCNPWCEACKIKYSPQMIAEVLLDQYPTLEDARKAYE